MIEDKIDSLEELLEFNRKIPTDTFVCFRGQSKASWDLLPSFYRGLDRFLPEPTDVDDGEWLGRLERDVYREFELRGNRYVPTNWEFSNPWHRMILAQHYGLPTRLLDWTKNAFVGAYFAVTENPNEDGALWCLEVSSMPFPGALGRRMKKSGFRLEQIDGCVSRELVSFHWKVSSHVVQPTRPANVSPSNKAIPSDQSGDPYRDGFLVAVEPPILEGRLHSQKSVFTIYVSYSENELAWDHRRYIEQMERHHSKSFLTKLIIPKDAKARIKRDLEADLINVDDIFPDLLGLIQGLSRKRNQTFDFWEEERKNWTSP